jgi:hypothetical protein
MFIDAKYYVGVLIYNLYYTLNKPVWLDPMHAKYRYETEKCFQKYYMMFKDLFNRLDNTTRAKIVSGIKKRIISEDVLLEKFTFDEWLEHIEELG